MKTVILGDVHGNVQHYKRTLDVLPTIYGDKNIKTIQLGDFGFKGAYDVFEKTIFDPDNPKKNMISMGNHDYYPYLNKPYSLGNWSYDETQDYSLMTIRGAFSIDRGMRREGLDWFENEEMNYEELEELFDIWCDLRPDVVVSHDIPQLVQQRIFHFHDMSITRNYLQMMFEEHKPKLWLYGHYHQDKVNYFDGTIFKCIEPSEFCCIENELEKMKSL